MKLRLQLVVCFSLISWMTAGTQTLIELDGAIKLGDFTDPNPEVGTLRWSGTDFEVWNGVIWASLTGNKEVGTVTDIDGNNYRTIRIGKQVWMTENLKVSHYRGGTPIDSFGPGQSHIWEVLETGAWCWYDTTGSGYKKYDRDLFGKLYNWYALEGDSLCPTNWHVPSDEDWSELRIYLGGFEVAGGSMKESDFKHWNEPNISATNESGFTGFPGGLRRENGSFERIGNQGMWRIDDDLGYNYYMLETLYGRLYRNDFTSKKEGLSIRCIRSN